MAQVTHVLETSALFAHAFQLKRDSPERLPAMDALIAACAKVQDAALVHRAPVRSQPLNEAV
jgi:hypothetical protein